MIVDWDDRDCLIGDNLEHDFRGWLSAPDPWKNHHLACDSRHHGSAAWFIEGSTFSEWKTSDARGSLLWIHGKRPLITSSYTSPNTEIFFFHSGGWKECSLVRQTLDIPFLVTYRVGQFHDYRGHRCNAESWACVTRILLL
jgi:hypothetical protein